MNCALQQLVGCALSMPCISSPEYKGKLFFPLWLYIANLIQYLNRLSQCSICPKPIFALAYKVNLRFSGFCGTGCSYMHQLVQKTHIQCGFKAE